MNIKMATDFDVRLHVRSLTIKVQKFALYGRTSSGDYFVIPDKHAVNGRYIRYRYPVSRDSVYTRIRERCSMRESMEIGEFLCQRFHADKKEDSRYNGLLLSELPTISESRENKARKQAERAERAEKRDMAECFSNISAYHKNHAVKRWSAEAQKRHDSRHEGALPLDTWEKVVCKCL